MSHPYVQSQEGLLRLPCTVSWRRSLETVTKAVESHQPSSRANMYSFMWGRTGGTLPEPYKTFRGLLMCTSVRNILCDTMTVWCPCVGHCAAQLVFMREYQNWQVRPLFFSQTRAGSHRGHAMDMKACGHAVVNCILPATSSSIQQWVSDGLERHVTDHV